MTTAKRRAIDGVRHGRIADAKHAQLARDSDAEPRDVAGELADALDGDVADDLLRLVFTACHPVLSTEASSAPGRNAAKCSAGNPAWKAASPCCVPRPVFVCSGEFIRMKSLSFNGTQPIVTVVLLQPWTLDVSRVCDRPRGVRRRPHFVTRDVGCAVQAPLAGGAS
jgi:hypothetical protein